MNRSEVFEKVNEIFREVFEDDSIVVKPQQRMLQDGIA